MLKELIMPLKPLRQFLTAPKANMHIRRTDGAYPHREYWYLPLNYRFKQSKYTPHQGKQECGRRLRQIKRSSQS